MDPDGPRFHTMNQQPGHFETFASNRGEYDGRSPTDQLGKSADILRRGDGKIP